MHHYSEPLIDSKGNALTGYYVKVISPADGSVQTLYADPSLTPIISVSGIADAAQCDSDGMVDFYVGVGTYHLDIYATDGVTLIRRRQNIGMNIDMDTAAAAVEAETAAAASAEAAAASALDSSDSAASSAASALAAAAVFSGTAGVVALPRFTPEAYMAPGRVEGTTDDGPALAAMSAAVNALGRGAVDFYSGRTYWVGSQTLNAAGPAAVAGATMRYAPNTPYPVEINGCTGPVVINMNGAKIKCLPSKRYGSFNADGTDYVGQATLPAYAGTPYFAMIWIHGCSGSVAVLNGELDGNIAAQNIGGGYGDNGIQFPMVGLRIEDNTGPIVVNAINGHHQGMDGMIANGPGVFGVSEQVFIGNSKFLNNGRQGCSHVGGNGWQYFNCKFNETGNDIGSMTYSAPGAGVDLEASAGRYVVGTRFIGCEFSNNQGICYNNPSAAPNGYDTAFKSCRFVGTVNFVIVPANKQNFFEDCLIVGMMANLYGSDNQLETTRFLRCTITDDVTLSPTGSLYNSSGGYSLISGYNEKALFEECHLQKTQNGGNSSNGAPGVLDGTGMRFHNCVAENLSTKNFILYGLYSGERTRIIDCNTIPSDLPGTASIPEQFLLNAGPSLDSYVFRNTANGFTVPLARYPATMDKATGKKLYYASATYNPPSLALAAKDTIQTMTVTGAALGDKVKEVSFSVNLAGARIAAWVSAANTVSYYAINENGANPLDLASGTLSLTVRQA